VRGGEENGEQLAQSKGSNKLLEKRAHERE
jgi:hypothetical protein